MGLNVNVEDTYSGRTATYGRIFSADYDRDIKQVIILFYLYENKEATDKGYAHDYRYVIKRQLTTKDPLTAAGEYDAVKEYLDAHEITYTDD